MVPDPSAIRVQKWRTERPLLVLNAFVSAGFWALAIQTPSSLLYIGAVVALIALVKVAWIAYVRGSAVRLGPAQFPELHAEVETLSRRMGLRRMPEVYLMQQDGALNAFAARFLRTHMVLLLSDLLEACGDDARARAMIIGHELGHIRAGHLYADWLLMPAAFVPFLGAALKRAREYTCDRYGLEAAGDREAALLGLSILSAGGRYGRLVNRDALMRQRHELRSVWMLVGEWLGSHPPLARRMAALAPELDVHVHVPVANRLRWVRPAFAAGMVIVIGAAAVHAYLPQFGLGVRPASTALVPATPETSAQIAHDLMRLQSMIEADLAAGRPLPWDEWDLYARWKAAHPDEPVPVDPFTGYWYDYDWHDRDYRIWSLGPDAKNRTHDDIVVDSRRLALKL
jgi:Zn-dependent protease with chaperone function